jgi:hypothetical protein
MLDCFRFPLSPQLLNSSTSQPLPMLGPEIRHQRSEVSKERRLLPSCPEGHTARRECGDASPLFPSQLLNFSTSQLPLRCWMLDVCFLLFPFRIRPATTLADSFHNKLRTIPARLRYVVMPLTVNREPHVEGRLQAAIQIRKQIAQLERKFSKLFANMPKYMLARNDFGLSAGEMKKIAQKLHAKAKERLASGRS